MTCTLHGKNFVAGSLRESNRFFTATSPLDREELSGRFSIASLDDVERAMQAAGEASEVLAGSAGEARATLLEAIAAGIMDLGDALIERAMRETALPAARLIGERARTCNQLRMFAAAAREGSWVDARIERGQPDRQPLPRPDLRRMKRPLGPVVVFGSSNFPLAFSVAGGDTASALCTGNPVVVKAHRAHPGTSELVAEAVQRAVVACGLPPGTFSMLHGEGSVIGTALVRHSACRAVGFTGSRTAGRALCDVAAARPDPIPVFAEMSSLNPVFVLPGALDARGDEIARQFVASMTLGVGQFCTKPGLVCAVQNAQLERFKAKVAETASAIPPASMLSADILAAYEHGSDAMASTPGPTIVARAALQPDDAKTQAAALVIATDATRFLARPELAEEVFGPFSLIVAADSVAQLATLAHRLDGQLTACVHGTAEDLATAGSLMDILARKAGRLIVNGFPTGVEVGDAMQHGGPWPATSDPRFTSLGSAALERFIRPVCYQDVPQHLLPDAVKDGNPLGLYRRVEGLVGRH